MIHFLQFSETGTPACLSLKIVAVFNLCARKVLLKLLYNFTALTSDSP